MSISVLVTETLPGGEREAPETYKFGKIETGKIPKVSPSFSGVNIRWRKRLLTKQAAERFSVAGKELKTALGVFVSVHF